jgi:predicted nucleotidyltransferase
MYMLLRQRLKLIVKSLMNNTDAILVSKNRKTLIALWFENMREVELQLSLKRPKKYYFYIMQLSPSDKNILQRYFSELPVKGAYIFGSYARHKAMKESSDLDILVELDHTNPIGRNFFTYQSDLQTLLKRKVDLVSSEGISRHIKPQIDQEKILIYERIGG